MIETMAQLGQLSTGLALVLSVFAFIASSHSAVMHSTGSLIAARRAMFANVGLTTLGCAILMHAFITSDFSLAYVAQNGNTQLPLLYRITALWGAHEGSLLLWAWYLTLISAMALRIHWDDHPLSMPWISTTLAAVQVGFLVFIVFLSNPFAALVPAPQEGQDLNPLLQDPGLAFHPPVLYLGYVGFVVPFAFAIASLLRSHTSTEWVKAVRRWALFSWLMLTTGIMFGGYWAYYELGWGGYWAWDPVENASLMPWLTGTALLHSMMVQDKRGMFRTWNVFLAVTTFLLTLMGTFLVRSGVLTSVHAFAVDPGRGAYMLGFMTVAMIVGYGLIILRGERLRSETDIESVLSRESAILGNNVLLMVATGTVFAGTLYPLIVETISGTSISVGAPYYNKVVIPLMLAVVFLMGFGPSVPWRRMNPGRLIKLLQLPLLGALAAGTVALIWGIRDILSLMCIGVVALAAVASFADINRGVSARRQTTGENIATATYRLFSFGRQRFGGLTIHLGIVIISAGLIASGIFQTAQTVSLRPGESFKIKDFVITLRSIESTNRSNHQARLGIFSVAIDGEPAFEIAPEKRFYPAREMATTEIAIRSFLAGDLYVFLGDETREGGVTVRAYWNPLVSWIWVGWLVVALGSALSLSIRRRKVPVSHPSQTVEGGAPAE